MSSPIPVSMSDELLKEIEAAASATGLSKQDVIRQSTKLGIPKLREQLGVVAGVKPFTKEEARQAFAPDQEWDKLESAMARRPRRRPEAD